MEAAVATSLRPFPALGSPVNAARAGWRCAPSRPRLSVVARLDGGLGKGVPTTNYVVPPRQGHRDDPPRSSRSSGTSTSASPTRSSTPRPTPSHGERASPPTPAADSSIVLPDSICSASGWCGEVRDVIYSNNGTVTVVYRVILKGTDGEAFRDATGTAKVLEGRSDDAVAAAEETAFSKACARFGFGLYLYHQDEIP
ncbi:hypothetical protein ACQ4PT_060747 [Festuca glaucescens]